MFEELLRDDKFRQKGRNSLKRKRLDESFDRLRTNIEEATVTSYTDEIERLVRPS